MKHAYCNLKIITSRCIRRRASHLCIYSEHVLLALQFTGECTTSCELWRRQEILDALSFHVRNSSISSGRQTVRRCWNRCRLNPQKNPTGAGHATSPPPPSPPAHMIRLTITAWQKSVCCIRPLRVKLGIVNKSRQLSGGPSCAHDAFIYHTDSAADHAWCGMIPYSTAAAASVVTIATTYPHIQHVFFFILRFP